MGKALLFFILCFLPSTAQAFWPVWWELGNEKRFIGPLVSYEKDEDQTHFVFRPLGLSYDSGEEEEDEGGVCNYIYPLGKISRDHSYFLPVYRSNRSEKASDFSFFLIFGGTSEKGPYGGFFPFYGKMYNRFAKDELGFVMWPVYAYTSDEGAEKKDILWPFFSIYGGTDKGFKAWPFYGDRDRPGVRRKQFFLWPVFFKEQKNLDTNEPMNSFFALPFYVHAESSTTEYKGILWPFFTYKKNQYKEEWNVPWPFVSVTTGETDGYEVFPFVSKEETDTDRKLHLFWPIYRHNEYTVKEQKYTDTSILAINRYVKDDRGTFFNIWPFFEYEKNEEDSTFLFPSIFPFRYEELNRIVKPLVTAYEYKRRDDITTTNVLYGLFTHEASDESWRTRFAFVIDIKRDENGPGFEFLSGIFGVDGKQVKVFYIPFPRAGEK